MPIVELVPVSLFLGERVFPRKEWIVQVEKMEPWMSWGMGTSLKVWVLPPSPRSTETVRSPGTAASVACKEKSQS